MRNFRDLNKMNHKRKGGITSTVMTSKGGGGDIVDTKTLGTFLFDKLDIGNFSPTHHTSGSAGHGVILKFIV